MLRTCWSWRNANGRSTSSTIAGRSDSATTSLPATTASLFAAI